MQEHVIICEPKDWPSRFEDFKQELYRKPKMKGEFLYIKTVKHDKNNHYITVSFDFYSGGD